MNYNNTDPNPAPPLQGRGVATAGGIKPHGTPLPCRGGAGVGSVTLVKKRTFRTRQNINVNNNITKKK